MTTNTPFDDLRRIDDQTGREYWSARELQPLLGYTSWRRFNDTIDRALLSASNAGIDTDTAFAQVIQLADSGNLGVQERLDYELSRYAAYLVAMNGDPKKQAVAEAQHYFAVQTHAAEQQAMLPPAQDTYVVEALRKTVALLDVIAERVQAQDARLAALEAPADVDRSVYPPTVRDYAQKAYREVMAAPAAAVGVLEPAQAATDVLYSVAAYCDLTGEPQNAANRRSLGQHAGVVAGEQGMEPYRATQHAAREYPKAIWDEAARRQRALHGGPFKR